MNISLHQMASLQLRHMIQILTSFCQLLQCLTAPRCFIHIYVIHLYIYVICEGWAVLLRGQRKMLSRYVYKIITIVFQICFMKFLSTL